MACFDKRVPIVVMDSTSNKNATNENWTPERLQSLLADQIPEDFRLEYKGLDALPLSSMKPEIRDAKREEIGKDVTALANSDGGVIIYGIKETRLNDGRPIPEKFQPVSMAEISREQLAQIIASNSEPTVAGVRILPVQTPGQNDPSQVCYIVLVPQSDTAHMAKDGRYYFRNESTTERMRDWQVRDAMNRRKVPKLKVEVRKEWTLSLQRPRLKLYPTVSNVSGIVARLFRIKITWPVTLGAFESTIEAWLPGYDRISGCEIGRSTSFELVATHDRLGPFFPGQKFEFEASVTAKNSLAGDFIRWQATIPEHIEFEMFAEDMAMQTEAIPINGIPPL